MALVLDSKQFAAYHARLAEQFRPTVLRGVRAGAARAVGYLVERTRTAPPANPAGIGSGGAVNTGNLARRWRKVDLPDGAALTNDAPYSPVVDGGRRAGSKFPPKAALIAWIMRKLLTSPAKGKGKRKGGTSASRLQQAARLYYPIARAIARRGLIARRIVSAPEAQTEIMRMVTMEVGAELAREHGRR